MKATVAPGTGSAEAPVGRPAADAPGSMSEASGQIGKHHRHHHHARHRHHDANSRNPATRG